MTPLNIIAACLVLVAVVLIIVLKIYSNKKNNNEKITFDSFINLYSDQIIKVLQDFIKILQVDIDRFETKDQYIEEVVGLSVESIKENATMSGIDQNLVNLLSTESIVSIVHKVLTSNEVEVFSVLEPSDIVNNEKLYDAEVVAALSEA